LANGCQSQDLSICPIFSISHQRLKTPLGLVNSVVKYRMTAVELSVARHIRGLPVNRIASSCAKNVTPLP
jgi:hypothetical protein